MGLAGLTAALLWWLADGNLRGMLFGLALLLLSAATLAAGWLAGRRRADEAVRECRQQAHLLGQLAEVWLWQTDAEHRLVRLQPPQGAPATAWGRGAFVGQLVWDRFADDGLRERVQAQAAFGDLQASGAWNGHGSSRWRLRGLPRWDAQGRFAGHLGSADPVEAAAAGRADNPTPVAAEPLAAAATEQAAFAYTLSHDLRAPIRVVDGFARILKEDYARHLDRIGNDHLDRVLAAAARMNHMIDALLSLSQLSTQALQRQPVNLTQLAWFVVEDLKRSAPQRQAEFDIEPDLQAEGDPTLLRLLLENLLGNAWKYSAKSAAARIALSCEHRDGRRVFLVSDNGAGFDMQFVDRLFGMFQRLHSANDYAGTGVGLASVQRIVRRHGGQVWAESAVGQGARFYFTLA